MANSIKLGPMNTGIRYGEYHYTYAHTKDECKKFEEQRKHTAADWLTSACMFTFLKKLHFLI